MDGSQGTEPQAETGQQHEGGHLPGVRDQEHTRTVLAAARAQYGNQRSQYLHGVMAALSWVLGENPRSPVSGAVLDGPPSADRLRTEEALARAAAQDALLGPEPGLSRRDFCMGASLALAWAAVLTEAPPVRVWTVLG